MDILKPDTLATGPRCSHPHHTPTLQELLMNLVPCHGQEIRIHWLEGGYVLPPRMTSPHQLNMKFPLIYKESIPAGWKGAIYYGREIRAAKPSSPVKPYSLTILACLLVACSDKENPVPILPQDQPQCSQEEYIFLLLYVPKEPSTPQGIYPK